MGLKAARQDSEEKMAERAPVMGLNCGAGRKKHSLKAENFA